jgi:hypothetical protein
VHQAPPLIARAPAAPRRSRARPAKSASHLPAPLGAKRAEAPEPGETPNTASTSGPTSKALGPMHAPSQT